MANTINMVPVDHVARLCVAATLNPTASAVNVCHVNSHPRLRFDDYLSALEAYGYNVPVADYDTWRKEMEQYVASTEDEKREEHALLGLYNMVTADLPGSTKAPELDDTNAAMALRLDISRTGKDYSRGGAVTEETIGVYLAYLIARGFMPTPSNASTKILPNITISESQRAALEQIGGRGRVAA